MKEQGRVTRIISPNLAEVACQKSAACGKCGVCKITDGDQAILEAINDLGAKVGDKVEVEIESKQLLLGATLVFLVPIAAMFLGYSLGRVLGAVLCLGFSFIIIKLLSHKLWPKNLEAKITRIVI